MTLYDEYPQFDGISASVMSRLILEARLAPADIQITASRLVWGMDYAEVGMDRSAVSRRLRGQIVPRIELILRNYDKCSGL